MKPKKHQITIPEFCNKHGLNVVELYNKIDRYRLLIGNEKRVFAKDNFRGYEPVISGKKTLMER